MLTINIHKIYIKKRGKKKKNNHPISFKEQTDKARGNLQFSLICFCPYLVDGWVKQVYLYMAIMINSLIPIKGN